MGQFSMEIYAPTGSLLSGNLKSRPQSSAFARIWRKSVRRGPCSRAECARTCERASQPRGEPLDNSPTFDGGRLPPQVYRGLSYGQRPNCPDLSFKIKGAWRRRRDSNPRYRIYQYDGLANRWFQPLTHVSGSQQRGRAIASDGEGGKGLGAKSFCLCDLRLDANSTRLIAGSLCLAARWAPDRVTRGLAGNCQGRIWERGL